MLLLLVGLAVGELAAPRPTSPRRGGPPPVAGTWRASRGWGRSSPRGRMPTTCSLPRESKLTQLLGLVACRFEPSPDDTVRLPIVQRDGTVTWGPTLLGDGAVGASRRSVPPSRSGHGGARLGRFVFTAPVAVPYSRGAARPGRRRWSTRPARRWPPVRPPRRAVPGRWVDRDPRQGRSRRCRTGRRRRSTGHAPRRPRPRVRATKFHHMSSRSAKGVPPRRSTVAVRRGWRPGTRRGRPRGRRGGRARPARRRRSPLRRGPRARELPTSACTGNRRPPGSSASSTPTCSVSRRAGDTRAVPPPPR